MLPTKANASPFRRKNPQESPASFQIAAKDLEEPAFQWKRLAARIYRVILKWGR
jgi:hypothetical protein